MKTSKYEGGSFWSSIFLLDLSGGKIRFDPRKYVIEMQFEVVKSNPNDTCKNGVKALPMLPPFFTKLTDAIQSEGIK